MKVDTPEPQHHAIPGVEKPPKIDTRVGKTGTYKYITRSSTKRVNHVKTFNNPPNMFKIDAPEKIKQTWVQTTFLA